MRINFTALKLLKWRSYDLLKSLRF